MIDAVTFSGRSEWSTSPPSNITLRLKRNEDDYCDDDDGNGDDDDDDYYVDMVGR